LFLLLCNFTPLHLIHTIAIAKAQKHCVSTALCLSIILTITELPAVMNQSIRMPFFLWWVLAGTANALSTPAVTLSTKANPLDKATIQSIQLAKELELRSQHDNEVFNALFVNVPERPNPIRLAEGLLGPPRNFPPGCLLRLGPNGAPADEGFMDGDGFVNCITFPPNGAAGTFSSTYIDTTGRKLEMAKGKRFRFRGTLGALPRGLPLLKNVIQNAFTFGTLQGQKDTCNTALAEHGGRVLALMEQCPPSEIQVGKDGSIRTIANNCRLEGGVPDAPISGGTMSAHGRTCPRTGERSHVSYTSASAPYIRVDTFDDGWKFQKSVAVNVACPTMLHDCALSDKYIVIFDFPLTLRSSRFLKDQFPLKYESGYGARIGLLPRDATTDTTIWFECEPGVVLHAVNAFETDDGNKVTVQVLRSVPSTSKGYLEEFSPSFLYEYELDTQTMAVREGCLNPNEPVEFPIINTAFTGKPTESVYCTSLRSIGGPLATHRQPLTGITLDGVTKFGLQDSIERRKGDILGKYSFPPQWFGVSEPTVVPKMDGKGEYVLLIATHVPEGASWQDATVGDSLRSQIVLLDGDQLNSGPVWTRDLPHHVHYGLHSIFLDWDTMV
jgi:carotenoid cleavage dioxygenase-like enzyme